MLAITCALTVDGRRVADTAAELDGGDQLVALDNLVIRWGRDDVSEQPAPSTLAVSAVDRAGLGLAAGWRIGAPVTVEATGQIPANGDGDQIVTDGDFDTLSDGNAYPRVMWRVGEGDWTRPPRTLVVDVDTPPLAGRAIAWAADTTPPGSILFLPPAAHSTDLTAWDQLRRAETADTWTATLDVALPVDGLPQPTVVGFALVGFRTPYPTTARTLYETTQLILTPADGPVTITATGLIPATQAGTWIGAAVWSNDERPYVPTWAQCGTATWAGLHPARRWAATVVLVVDNLTVTAPVTTERTVRVWTGRITDLDVTSDKAAGALVKMTAADSMATLNNLDVGDVPWPEETIRARVTRMLPLLPEQFRPTVRYDPTVTNPRVSWRDVDRQSAGGLLGELATSAGAVLWSADHRLLGHYLWLEDPQLRSAASRRLVLGDGGRWGATPDPSANRGDVIGLSACDVLRDPVTWTQDTTDLATRVQVGWREQTLDDDGLPRPTDRTVIATDPELEAVHGPHTLVVGTQLSTAAAAAELAGRLLTRYGSLDWRLLGVEWDTRLPTVVDVDTANSALNLLDGTLRIGAPLVLTELPAWSPIPDRSTLLHVEGGTWSFTGGRWVLQLATSQPKAGADSVTWWGLPAGPTWATLSPAIDWRLLGTVGNSRTPKRG